jgi:dsDNA-specific endonuclease/ATPase MutS2
MSSFAPNDPVQVSALGIGKGVIREVRNRERYLVDVNGHHVVASSSQLRLCPKRRPRRTRWYVTAPRRHGQVESFAASGMIDLHGNTVYDAIGLVLDFLDDAFLLGVTRVRIIHGRSGGKIRAAVHKLLTIMPSIRSWALDQHNPGVTIVRL